MHTCTLSYFPTGILSYLHTCILAYWHTGTLSTLAFLEELSLLIITRRAIGAKVFNFFQGRVDKKDYLSILSIIHYLLSVIIRLYLPKYVTEVKG